MPEISRFLGIVIAMFYRNHAPPHFHALYGEYQITVEIETGTVHGIFPKRALRLVLEWTEKAQERTARQLESGDGSKAVEEDCALGVKT